MSQRKTKSKSGITKGSVPFANHLPNSENTTIVQISQRPIGKVVVLRAVRKSDSSVIRYYELFCSFVSATNGWVGCGYQFYASDVVSLKRAKHALQVRAASHLPEAPLKDSGSLQRPKINAFTSQDTSDLRELLAQATLVATSRPKDQVRPPVPQPCIVSESFSPSLLPPRPQFNSRDYPTVTENKSWLSRFITRLRNFFRG